MQNINELIGIIEGINFDGIINDKEVSSLQSWVDRNRNLAYEKKQLELINLIDNVLEDHIIDENEKKKLISCAEYFLDEKKDDYGKFYELYGIIEGIICDGEVNEAEVISLKNWMDIYGDFARQDKKTHELCIIVDAILEDGIVTKEEQNELLNILRDFIKNAQLETKIEYLCQLVKERKSIGIELIDVLNNGSAINEIHKRAEKQLMMSIDSYDGVCTNREIIVVSLTLIAMLEYDGNFYENVREIYTHVYYKYPVQKVEGTIRSILSRYKKHNESGSRERIINVALENAIVPKNFLSAFFEFVFDIYKLNFDYDIPHEPYDDFKFVYEGLRSSMLSSGDDISVNVTQKTYKLIASTKQLITREDGLDAIINLSILILKLIDKRFWNKEIKIINPYLKFGYDGWEKQLKETSTGRRKKRANTDEFRSRWEPKFMLDNDHILYLVPPVHRIKSQYNYKNICIEVLNDGEVLYRDNNCYIKEIIGGYQVEPQKIEINKPLEKLKYRLLYGDEVIYDSKDKLFRNYIVFNEKGQEIVNNTDFEGTAFIIYRAGTAELNNIFSDENYCIGYKLVKIGDAINIGNDVFNFSSMVKPGIFGIIHKDCALIVDKDKILPVYKEANVVAFEIENGSGKIEVVINGKANKLSDLKSKTTVRNNITKYIVELGLTKSGIYSVEVNLIADGKIKRIIKEEFVYDKQLEFEITMLDESDFNLRLISGIIDRSVNTEMSLYNFEPNLINFEYDGHECAYRLPLDLGSYRIDDGPWNCSNADLWIDDIKLDSKMELFDSECNGAIVYDDNGKIIEDSIAIVDKGAYKVINIGFLNSYKATNKYVLLLFTSDGKKKYGMFCYNKCVIDEERTEIHSLNNHMRIAVTPIFHGKNHVFFEIIDNKGNNVYKSNLLRSGQTEELSGLNSFEEYIFNFYEKTKILQLKKNTLLYKTKETFYAKEDFPGRVFKIETAYFDQYVSGKFVEKGYHFNKAYVRITNALDNGTFEGEIFVKTRYGELNLNNINPVEIEICSEIVDDTMDVYMTNCGDGLLMDFENHGILNSMSHPTAPDIFLFNVSMKEA